jgi:hypothetical protein
MEQIKTKEIVKIWEERWEQHLPPASEAERKYRKAMQRYNKKFLEDM